jgi:hypothetical protein
MALLDEVKRRALRHWIPPARLQLDRWIEETIVLPSSVSALPGRVKLYPYQRAIASATAAPTSSTTSSRSSLRRLPCATY